MPASCDDLKALVAEFDAAGGYTTECLLKQGADRLTELVRDAQGNRYVRKCVEAQAGRLELFRRLTGVRGQHLAAVRSAQQVGDTLLVVSDYIEGETLRSYVEREGPLSPEVACALLCDVANALNTLHTVPGGAIVHRDVNPGNVIVRETPERLEAWLIDCDIARSWRKDAQQDTRLWGTAGYAAPEQFGFRQTDARTDVFGLGMTLRFMLTGQEPGACARVALSKRHEQVIAQATALDPQDRYPSAHALFDAYQAACKGHGPVRVPRAARKPNPPAGKLPGNPDALQGLTRRSKLALAAWRVWQVLVAFAVVLCTGAFVTHGVGNTPDRLSVPMAVVFELFMVLVPGVIIANPLGVTSRWDGLRRHRYPKLLGLLVLDFVVLCALILVVDWLLPQ